MDPRLYLASLATLVSKTPADVVVLEVNANAVSAETFAAILDATGLLDVAWAPSPTRTSTSRTQGKF